MSNHFRQACRFLQGNENIAGYLTAIERNAQLLREIRSALPAPLDEHCLHASLDAGVLTLLTDSPVWSSRLRFFAPELERVLRPRHASIVTCRIRVQPRLNATSPEAAANRKSSLSAKTAQHLMDAAAGVADAELAAVLRRLAKAGAKGC